MSFSIAAYYQAAAGIFLGGMLFVILALVQKEKISDKYGLTCTLITIVLIAADFVFEWRSVSGSIVFDSLLLLFFALTLILMVTFAVRLTRHSMERRRYIQKVALLRFELEALAKKTGPVLPLAAEEKQPAYLSEKGGRHA